MANQIFVIAPYWLDSVETWVFDDEAVGLPQEPFVSDVPEMIDELVADIPNARQGFRLLFSAAPFPAFPGYWDRLLYPEAAEGPSGCRGGGKRGTVACCRSASCC